MPSVYSLYLTMSSEAVQILMSLISSSVQKALEHLSRRPVRAMEAQALSWMLDVRLSQDQSPLW
jgi:hypothetical protein